MSHLDPKSYTDHYGFDQRPDILHVDFHRAGTSPGVSFEDKMRRTYREARAALRTARSRGYAYIAFTHGGRELPRGRRSTRSVVRGLIRSPEATPYVERSRCILTPAVTVAALR